MPPRIVFLLYNSMPVYAFPKNGPRGNITLLYCVAEGMPASSIREEVEEVRLSMP